MLSLSTYWSSRRDVSTSISCDIWNLCFRCSLSRPQSLTPLCPPPLSKSPLSVSALCSNHRSPCALCSNQRSPCALCSSPLSPWRTLLKSSFSVAHSTHLSLRHFRFAFAARRAPGHWSCCGFDPALSACGDLALRSGRLPLGEIVVPQVRPGSRHFRVSGLGRRSTRIWPQSCHVAFAGTESRS